MELAATIAVTGWLALCAWWDYRLRLVPNWLTVSAIVAAASARLVTGSNEWLPWTLALLMLAAVLFGWLPGGDGKGLMALAIVSPSVLAAACTGAAVLQIVTRRKIPGFVGFFLGVLALGGWQMYQALRLG